MKQPEPEPRDCIVIVRVSQVEEAENLLIDEVEPQKAVIFARTAVKRKREIRWISNCSQNVPGCRYEECNEESADGARQNHIVDNHSGKQEEANTGCHAQPCT